MKWSRRKIVAAALVVSVGLLAAAGLVLPGAGLRWGLIQVLHRAGMVEVSVSDADLSLFGGHVAVRNMVARAPSGKALGLNDLALRFHWAPLLHKRLMVERIALEGLEIDVQRSGDGFVVNGLPLAVAAAGNGGSTPWSFEVAAFELTSSTLVVADGNLRAEIVIDRLVVENLHSWDPQSPVSLRLEGRINGTPITLAGTATPFAARTGFDLHLNLAQVDLAGLSAMAAPSGLPTLAGKADLDVTLVGNVEGKGLALHVDGKMAAQDLAVGGAMPVSAQSLMWTGRADMELAGGQPVGRAEGKLDLGPLQSTIAGYEASQRHTSVEGSVAFGPNGGGVTAKVQVLSEGFALRDPALGQDWLMVEKAEAADVTLAADGGVSTARLALDGISSLRRDKKGAEKGFPWRLEARRLQVDHASLDAGGAVSATEAKVEGLILRLTRTATGFLGFPTSAASGAVKQVSTPPQPSPLPRLALGKLTLSGNARLMFEDRTMPEAVRLDLQPFDLTLSGLDSSQPDHDSPFSLKATLGEATIAANGLLRPFAQEVSAQVKGQIRALELPPLSPYMASALGIHLHTGHFDGEVQVAVKKGSLNGKMDLVLSNLFVAQPDANAPIARKVEMPIETVLDLLRDGEDRIRLSLPIGGNLANPDLDVSDAVSQAVAGALKSTVLTTLKVAFPVATLISLVVDAEDRARLSLAPLAFAPGSAGLADQHRSLLGTIAQLMKSRPALKLTLCGKAGSADWPILADKRRREESPLLTRLQKLVGSERKGPETSPPDHDALAELADSRAGAAKEFLVDHAGIDAGRLFECRPEVEIGEQDKGPRVELLL